jgi:hypothetical protein
MSTELDLSHPELAPAPTTLPNVCCESCGWQDERYGPWGTIDNVLPCPNCGGHVSLIARGAP